MLSIIAIAQRVADSSLDEYEREEKETEEHMVGRPDRPHSRDKAGIGPPAGWNRRKRIKDDDPDFKPDSDLSLNYKTAKKEKSQFFDAKARFEAFTDKLHDIGPKFEEMFRGMRDEITVKNNDYATVRKLREQEEILKEATDRTSASLRSVSTKNLPGEIEKLWKNTNLLVDEGQARTTRDFILRAGIVQGVYDLILKTGISKSAGEVIAKSHKDIIDDIGLIRLIAESDESDVGEISSDMMERFAVLTMAYKILRNYPDKVTAKDFSDEDKIKEISQQVRDMSELASITSTWRGIIKDLKTDDEKFDLSGGNWKGALDKINDFLYKPRAIDVDPKIYMYTIANQIKDEHGSLPSELEAVIKGYGVNLSEIEKEMVAEQKSRFKTEKSKVTPEMERSKSESEASGRQREKRERTERSIKERREKFIEERRKVRPDEEAEGSEEKERPVEESEYMTPSDEELLPIEESRSISETEEEAIKQALEELGRMRGKRREEIREIVDEFKKIADREKPSGNPKKSASNKLAQHRMTTKTSAYHGIVYQGHPTDSAGSAEEKYDKRYFGEKHYESILASAMEFLKEDWLRYGWNGGDAPVRAALDLAIHTANDGLYQSKIDTNAYNMLLNKLAGWDFDIFSETILGGGKARKTAAMKSPVQEILKIADELRASHPDLTVRILKNVHAIMRTATAEEIAEKEREIIRKVFQQTRKDMKLAPLSESELEHLVEVAIEALGSEGGRISSDLENHPEMLSAMINLAYSNPSYRKCLPSIVVAAKKMMKKPEKKQDEKKGKKDKKDEEQEIPEPSIPKSKKKPVEKAKKSVKKASISLAKDDINW